jgi:hypothetical protein
VGVGWELSAGFPSTVSINLKRLRLKWAANKKTTTHGGIGLCDSIILEGDVRMGLEVDVKILSEEVEKRNEREEDTLEQTLIHKQSLRLAPISEATSRTRLGMVTQTSISALDSWCCKRARLRDGEVWNEPWAWTKGTRTPAKDDRTSVGARRIVAEKEEDGRC